MSRDIKYIDRGNQSQHYSAVYPRSAGRVACDPTPSPACHCHSTPRSLSLPCARPCRTLRQLPENDSTCRLLRTWIRLGLGSPTLSNLSRRPCECRLMWPRILHGVRKEGGGPIYNPGCKATAPQDAIGLPPKPDLISNYHEAHESGRCKQDTRL